MDYDYLKYKKILIVDDEADLREMVTSILDQDGFKIIKTAGTVAEALKICREWEPDLAVLDVMLPDGNGFSLFEQMRTFTEVPVLFLTARGEDEDKLKGLGLGADDYMVKPFLPKELKKTCVLLTCVLQCAWFVPQVRRNLCLVNRLARMSMVQKPE